MNAAAPPQPSNDATAAADDDADDATDDTAYLASIDDAAPFQVDVGAAQFSVIDIVRKIDRNLIVLAPDYQRGNVWDDDRRSVFVESVLLSIPLPPIYLNQLLDGRYVVIDGKQRLTALHRFAKGLLTLRGLPRWYSLNGKRFADLDPKLQAQFEDSQVACHVLKPSTPIELVYEIFYRINTGGMSLTRQEIRNGILQGPVTELLRRLATAPEREKATGYLNPTRMKDQEIALRCIAFRRRDPVQNYKGDMDAFLTETMRDINHAGQPACDQIEPEFRRTMAECARQTGRGAEAG